MWQIVMQVTYMIIHKIKELLKKQISSPVKFMQSVEKMIDDGVDTFVEIGPGKHFLNLLKKSIKM